MIRPSWRHYWSTFRTRRTQFGAVLAASAAIVLTSLVSGLAFSRGRLAPLAFGLALLLGIPAVTIISLIAYDLVYLARIKLTVSPVEVTRHGFPFRRRSARLWASKGVVRYSLKYTTGQVRPVWLLMDSARLCQCWLSADYWDDNSIRTLAQALRTSVQGSFTDVVDRDALNSVVPGPALRW